MALMSFSFRAVLFDFDGTLVDSYPAIAASVNHVRSRRGMLPLSVDEVKRYVGRGPEYLLANTVPGGVVAEDLPAYRAHHPQIMNELTELLPEAADTLSRLSRAGLPLGLCSNKPRIFSQKLLEYLQIARYFQVVLGPEDVARLKPAPDMVRLAVERLRLQPHDVLYVGDMTVDIETARQSGVTVWVIPNGSDSLATLEAARPDRILQRLSEVAAALTAG